MSRDFALILAARLLRAFGFGLAAVLVGLHLERRGLSPGAIGLVLTIGLLSAAISGVVAAALSSRIGRRYTLAGAGGLRAIAGNHPPPADPPPVPPRLPPRAEAPIRAAAISAREIRTLAPISALFAIAALGGGLVVNAVIAYWLHVRFGAPANVLGPAFAAIALLQAASYEASGRLANRIGLIRTMVFTHIPSNVILILVPLSPSLPWAIGLLLGRFSLSQMDVPARQAYIVSIVPPAERAGAVAFTGLVRGLGQALGPMLSGAAIQGAALGVPFFLAGGLKLVYDLSLYAAFRSRRAEHETVS